MQEVDKTWKTTSCSNRTVVSADNTVYTVQSASSNEYRLIAVRDNSLLWTQRYKRTDTSNPDAFLTSLNLGKDGDLYVVARWSNITTALLRIDRNTGALVFRIDLPTSGHSTSYDYRTVNEVMLMDQIIGVINRDNVYFVNYDGDELSQYHFDVPDGVLIRASHTTSGHVYFVTSKYIDSVAGTRDAAWHKDPTASSVHQILPWGSATHPRGESSGGVYFSRSGVLYYFDSTGQLIYNYDTSIEPGAVVQGYTYTVDSEGKFILMRTIYTIESERHVVIDSFDQSGDATRLFYSKDSLGTEASDFFTPTRRIEDALGDGKIYMILCHTFTSISTCHAGHNPILVAVTAEVTYDYWRYSAFNALLDESIVNVTVLGDSYISGQGLPGYIPPSDTNECYRSRYAFPLGVMNSSNNLNLEAFRACAGATTEDVLNGQKGEPPQIAALSASTDAVMLSVGGNDIHFSTFAAACVASIIDPEVRCDESSPIYDAVMSELTTPEKFPSRLTELYNEVKMRAPNADVYAIGYPLLVPPASQPRHPGTCLYLSGDERTAIRNVISELNNVIASAVNSAGPKFHFVDLNGSLSPFLGHELCTGQSYFHGANILVPGWSFHPNLSGNAAYGSLLEQYLVQ